MISDSHFDQRDQVFVSFEHQLLHVRKERRVFSSKLEQTAQIGADALGDLICLDLCPGQFRISGIAQGADQLFALDDAGEIGSYNRHASLAVEGCIDLADMLPKGLRRAVDNLVADTDFASLDQLVEH
ncbi:hypothetical protein D3C85_1500290 [compost metagenome]